VEQEKPQSNYTALHRMKIAPIFFPLFICRLRRTMWVKFQYRPGKNFAAATTQAVGEGRGWGYIS
jgi:hypothetical protein